MVTEWGPNSTAFAPLKTGPGKNWNPYRSAVPPP